jgi:hypothetical protein
MVKGLKATTANLAEVVSGLPTSELSENTSADGWQPPASTPTGTRTPVPRLRTKYPRPLDDGGVQYTLS